VKLGRSRVQQAYANFKGKIVNTHSMVEAIKKGIKIGQETASKWKTYMEDKIKKIMGGIKINGRSSGGIHISAGGSGISIHTGGSGHIGGGGGIHINANGLKINTNDIHKAISDAHAKANQMGKSISGAAHAKANEIAKAISGAHANISGGGSAKGGFNFSTGGKAGVHINTSGITNGIHKAISNAHSQANAIGKAISGAKISAGGSARIGGGGIGGGFSFKVHRANRRRLQSSTSNGADSIKVSSSNGLDLKKTYDSTGMGEVKDDDLEGSNDQVKMTDANTSANLIKAALSVMMTLMFVILH